MLKFICRRLIYICLSLIVITIMLFTLFRQLPGDPVLQWMLGDGTTLTPEQFDIEYARISAMLGMDGPVIYQYFRWITLLLQGDWGWSFVHNRAVLDVIRVPIGWTVVLNIAAISISFLITIPLGIFSAVKRGKAFDNGTMVFTTIGFSMPTFLVGILMIVIFAVFLQVLPTSGMISPIPPTEPFARFLDRIRFAILPLMTLTFVGLAGMTRYVRAQMCDALSEDYVRTARSKGLTEKVVIFSHAFRNALVPVVTLVAGTLIGLFAGSLVIERTFGWSGMGVVMIDSLMAGDYAIVKAMNVFYAFVSLTAILIMDLAYGLVDPRIKVAG